VRQRDWSQSRAFADSLGSWSMQADVALEVLGLSGEPTEAEVEAG